jgi:hypothetical protein
MSLLKKVGIACAIIVVTFIGLVVSELWGRGSIRLPVLVYIAKLPWEFWVSLPIIVGLFAWAAAKFIWKENKQRAIRIGIISVTIVGIIVGTPAVLFLATIWGKSALAGQVLFGFSHVLLFWLPGPSLVGVFVWAIAKLVWKENKQRAITFALAAFYLVLAWKGLGLMRGLTLKHGDPTASTAGILMGISVLVFGACVVFTKNWQLRITVASLSLVFLSQTAPYGLGPTASLIHWVIGVK